jgi:hypothetical protein
MATVIVSTYRHISDSVGMLDSLLILVQRKTAGEPTGLQISSAMKTFTTYRFLKDY